MKLMFFIITISISSVFAESFSKKHFELAIGAQLNSILYKRGIITYGGSQAFPLVSVKLFHPDLLFAGSSLYYKLDLIKDSLNLRTRLNLNSTGDMPLYESSEDEDKRVERDQTNEFSLYLEYNNDRQDYFRLETTRDLVAHFGVYNEVHANIQLLNFSKGSNKDSLFLLGMFGAVGFGDKSHNEYLYGEGARGYSQNNIEYGLTIKSPKVIDLFWPTFKLTRFEIYGDKNRSAQLVDERDGWSIEILSAFRVF